MSPRHVALALLLTGSLSACGAAPSSHERFARAVQSFAERDRLRDWDSDACRRLSEEFQSVASGELTGPAHLQAGLVLQRCGNREQAQAQLRAAVAATPSLQLAQAQLLLYQLEESPAPDAQQRAVALLEQVARERPDPDVLTDLVRLLLERNAESSGLGCGPDTACALSFLKQALTLNPDHPGALHQLAVYYLLQSKTASAPFGPKWNLEQARRLCERVARQYPSYAPVRNTAGLVEVQAGELEAAAAHFERASNLDPSFFDAYKNLATTQLLLRSPILAQAAFRRALALRPKSYEAWLGLSFALRLAATRDDLETIAAAIEQCLDRCVALAPSRPEAWFNRAVLYQERGRADLKAAPNHLRKSSELLTAFLERAGDSRVYAAKVREARSRQEDNAAMLEFLQRSATDRSP